MTDKAVRLNIEMPASLKKKVKVAAAKSDKSMQDWVISRIKIGLDTRVKT